VPHCLPAAARITRLAALAATSLGDWLVLDVMSHQCLIGSHLGVFADRYLPVYVSCN